MGLFFYEVLFFQKKVSILSTVYIFEKRGIAMAYCKIIFFAFFALFYNTFAQPVPPWYETGANKNNPDTQIDSVAIYENLYAQANANANYKPNIIGMAVGGTLTVLGTVFIISAATDTPEKKSINCNGETTSASKKTCEFQESTTNTIQDFGSGLKVGFSYIIGATLSLIGIPIFIYNFNKYESHRNNAIYCDEIQQKLQYYKSRHNSTQLVITPSVNLMGSIGFNALLRF